MPKKRRLNRFESEAFHETFRLQLCQNLAAFSKEGLEILSQFYSGFYIDKNACTESLLFWLRVDRIEFTYVGILIHFIVEGEDSGKKLWKELAILRSKRGIWQKIRMGFIFT